MFYQLCLELEKNDRKLVTADFERRKTERIGATEMEKRVRSARMLTRRR